MKVFFFDDDAITTICDRCGDDIAIDEANYAGSELPTWEGATLCNECYRYRGIFTMKKGMV